MLNWGNSSGDVLSGVSVTATELGNQTKTLEKNREENITTTSSNDNGNYTIQIGYRGDWQASLVFKKDGYNTYIKNVASNDESHEEDEVITIPLSVTLSQ